VLLPNERIRRDAKERLEVVRAQRAQLEKLTPEDGLPIE
jgi:hypothetical protein